jgi:hypothetical protein
VKQDHRVLKAPKALKVLKDIHLALYIILIRIL